MVSLPQELVDAILDILGLYIHREPYKFALRSCLLVSAAFAAASRKHLFRSVEINGARHFDIFPRTRALKDILSPESKAFGQGIAQYIREFTIKLNELQSRSDNLRCILADILDNLHDENYGIDELTLYGIRSYHGKVGISWSTLGPYFTAAFVAICQSPRLRKLKITGVYCIPPTLFDGTFIKGLHLSYITFSYAKLLGGPRLPRPQLDLLETDSVCPHIINNLLAEPSFVSHLQELKFLAPQGKFIHRHRLIAITGKVLKRLYVTTQPSPNSTPSDLDFSICPNVEYLALDSDPRVSFSNSYPVFGLPRMPIPAACVKHLRVRTQAPNISILDEVLANGTFPSLSRLNLDLVIGRRPVHSDLPELESLEIKNEFKKMKGEGRKYLPSLPPDCSLDIDIVDCSNEHILTKFASRQCTLHKKEKDSRIEGAMSF